MLPARCTAVAGLMTLFLLNPSPLLGAGNIKGHCLLEKIKGHPEAGYQELYEWNLFISPPGSTPIGPHRRLGAACEVQLPGGGRQCSLAIITGDGCYCADGLAVGNYSLLLSQPIFFAVPRVMPNVTIAEGQTTTRNIELPIDYSTYFVDVANNQWTPPDTAWYQTFVATGSSITGLSWILAGRQATTIEAAILQDNGNADVRFWQVLGTATKGDIGTLGDTWVRWRSGEIRTIPGTRYAARLRGTAGSALTFQPFRRTKDAMSYSDGRAYNSAGQPQNYDLNYTVFSDNAGTRITLCKRRCCIGNLTNLRERWAQSFKAAGAGLAGVDLWAAGANLKWDLDLTWKIHIGEDPAGQQIGPTKTTKAGFQGPGVGLHGVSYSPGEVPLIPGRVYTIEAIITNPPPESPGFNPYKMQGDDDYADGMAFAYVAPNWSAVPDADLAMTVMEYAILMEVTPTQINRTILLGDSLPAETLMIRNPGYGTLTYSISSNSAFVKPTPTSGTSDGETDLITLTYQTAGLPGGVYTGLLTIINNGESGLRQIPVTLTVQSIAPDFDGDGDVDQSDFGRFQACLSGSGFAQLDPACAGARLDNDEDVDFDDFGIFQGCFSGPGVRADRNCLP